MRPKSDDYTQEKKMKSLAAKLTCCSYRLHTVIWNLSGSSKRGVGVFLRARIFLSKMHPLHTQSSPSYIHTHAVILQNWSFCHALASAMVSLPSFVSPFSGTVLLLWCSWLNITMYYGILTFERKAPFATNFIQNRGIGLFLRVGQFFEIRVLLHVLLN